MRPRYAGSPRVFEVFRTPLTLPPYVYLRALRADQSFRATKPAVRLTILGDNAVTRPGVKAVWGFACLVEARGHTVLFDTGADPAVLKENLAALEVSPARIEAVVISHVHGDHTWGAPGLGKLRGPAGLHSARSGGVSEGDRGAAIGRPRLVPVSAYRRCLMA